MRSEQEIRERVEWLVAVEHMHRVSGTPQLASLFGHEIRTLRWVLETPDEE